MSYSVIRESHLGQQEPLPSDYVSLLLKEWYSGGSSERQSQQSQQSDEPQSGQNTVAVVGGGLAGCFCASLLHAKGYSVDLYEKNDRLGGRVWTHPVCHGHANAEFGAELIGKNHLWLINLIKKYKLSLIPLISSSDYKLQNQYDTFQGERVDSNVYDIISHVLRLIANDANLMVYPQYPWLNMHSPKIREWDNTTLAHIIDTYVMTKYYYTPEQYERARQFLHAHFMADNLSSTEKQGYLGVLCQIRGHSHYDANKFWNDVERYRCAEGNETLCNHLVKDQENLNIHFGKRISSVTFTEGLNRAQVTFGDDSGSSSASGTKSYKFIIMAIPPYQIESIVFNPDIRPLPSMCFGHGFKYICNVKSRFWKDSNKSPNCMFKKDDFVVEFWESTESQMNPDVVLCGFGYGSPKIDRVRQCYIPPDQIVSDTYVDYHYGYSYGGLGHAERMKAWHDFCPHGLVYFVGEHTSASFYGYMEGALESSYHIINRIVHNLDDYH